MRNYEHKFDGARQLVAIQITADNVGEVAEWTNGRELSGDTPAVEIAVQGGASSVVAVEDDYVILDSNHEFHVRSPQIFEAKYKESENQDEELDFSGPEDSDDIQTVEAEPASDYAWSSDELSGDDGDADRLQ